MIVSKPTNKKKKKISKYTVLSLIMVGIFTVITFRLAYLQLLNYDEYKDKADVTSTRFIAEKAQEEKYMMIKGMF